MINQYYCQCPSGLETALVAEINEIAEKFAPSNTQGTMSMDIGRGGVGFRSDEALAYALNLHARIPSRVLELVKTRIYRSENDLYTFAKQIAWENYFAQTQTFRIDLTASKSPLKSINFAALKIKDAIVDRFRETKGSRPSIDTHNPNVRIYVHLYENEVYYYIDLSGEPLFKRGWRQEKGEAPLKENLAAGILRLTNWQPGMVLYDPMCGSGTFIVEAAQMCINMPSGANRRFGLENLKHINKLTWNRLKLQAEEMRQQALLDQDRNPYLPLLAASDISERMLQITQANLQRAGISYPVKLLQGDARLTPAPFQLEQLPEGMQAIMLTNPPYGERIELAGQKTHRVTRVVLEESEGSKAEALSGKNDNKNQEAADFAFAWSTQMKQSMQGWRCYILSSDLQYQNKLRLKPTQRFPLYNGPIDCRLFWFDVR